MGFTTLERMKAALLDVAVTPLERIVLFDMAVAVDDDAPQYSWGHDRLALALGKAPGSKAATRAVDRVLSALRDRGLVTLTVKPHRGRRAEYALAVLDGNAPRSDRGASRRVAETKAPRSDRGPLAESDAENAPRSEPECTPVSDVMHPGQTGVPLPISLPTTPHSVQSASDADALTAVVIDVDDVFAEAWSRWPKKTARKAARAKFATAASRHPRGLLGLADDVAAHAAAYVHHQHPAQYVPMLSTWLNGDRWDDPLPGPRARGAQVDHNAAIFARYLGSEGEQR